jgi:ribosomal protein S6
MKNLNPNVVVLLLHSVPGEKSRNAEEMNKMNETVEKLRAALKALQLQLEGMGVRRLTYPALIPE